MTTPISRSAFLTAAGAAALAAGVPLRARAADRVGVDYAYYNPPSLVLKAKGWLEEALAKRGTSVDWVLSLGSNKANGFLAAGAVQFGSTAGSAALLARANGTPIKTVFLYSRPEWTALVVPKDSAAKSVRDLRGKRVAATRGTDPWFFLLRSLAAAGLQPTDVQLVDLQHPDGRTALERGQVDAWAGLDPHMAAIAARRGIAAALPQRRVQHVGRAQRARGLPRAASATSRRSSLNAVRSRAQVRRRARRGDRRAAVGRVARRTPGRGRAAARAHDVSGERHAGDRLPRCDRRRRAADPQRQARQARRRSRRRARVADRLARRGDGAAWVGSPFRSRCSPRGGRRPRAGGSSRISSPRRATCVREIAEPRAERVAVARPRGERRARRARVRDRAAVRAGARARWSAARAPRSARSIPTLQAIRAVPSLAWVPLILLWLGIGETAKITLVAIGAFFPIYVALVSGIHGVDRKLVEVGTIFGLSRTALIARVLVPATLPQLLVGARIGLTQAWLFLVAAELLAATNGLGFLLTDGQQTSRTDEILVAILLFALCGKLSESGMRRLEKRLVGWTDTVRRVERRREFAGCARRSARTSCSTGSISTSRAASGSRSWARAAAASRRCCAASRGSSAATRGRSRRPARSASCSRSRGCSRGSTSSATSRSPRAPMPSARACRTCSRSSGSRTPRSGCRRSCPAGWRSAPRWRARSCAIRRCCCSTSRSPRSTRCGGSSCARPCARSSSSRARRRSW